MLVCDNLRDDACEPHFANALSPHRANGAVAVFFVHLLKQMHKSTPLPNADSAFAPSKKSIDFVTLQCYTITMKEYIAYSGEKFTIEWYYNQGGESQPLEFFNALSAMEQQKFFHLVKRMGDFGFISDKTKFRNEGDGIYAFKPQPNRFLSFFFEGKKIIITNAFVKRRQKLKKQDKDCAISARADYKNRIKEDSYYDKD